MTGASHDQSSHCLYSLLDQAGKLHSNLPAWKGKCRVNMSCISCTYRNVQHPRL
jgi:hypothetical protein